MAEWRSVIALCDDGRSSEARRKKDRSYTRTCDSSRGIFCNGSSRNYDGDGKNRKLLPTKWQDYSCAGRTSTSLHMCEDWAWPDSSSSPICIEPQS